MRYHIHKFDASRPGKKGLKYFGDTNEGTSYRSGEGEGEPAWGPWIRLASTKGGLGREKEKEKVSTALADNIFL